MPPISNGALNTTDQLMLFMDSFEEMGGTVKQAYTRNRLLIARCIFLLHFHCIV